MGRVTARRNVLRLADNATGSRPDSLVVEEPLEVRVAGAPVTVTMRTPGDDFDLVAGFLVAEGAITRSDEVATMRYCAGAAADGTNTYNVVDVALAPGVVPPVPRSQLTTSACGVCGSASIDLVRARGRWAVRDDPVQLGAATLAGLPEALRAAQRVFERTGGLHAAGLFTASGELVCLREDVGRHNAVDKVVGAMLRADRLPLSGHLLLVSGRASFELVQKALAAGIPVLAAVSAPSSLAVDLAVDAGMTLVGFLRGSSMNVYAGAHRVVSGGGGAAPRAN